LVSSFDHVFAYIIFQRPPFIYPVPPFWPCFDIIDISLPFNGAT
jgi:hypothetical protein